MTESTWQEVLGGPCVMRLEQWAGACVKCVLARLVQVYVCEGRGRVMGGSETQGADGTKREVQGELVASEVPLVMM